MTNSLRNCKRWCVSGPFNDADLKWIRGNSHELTLTNGVVYSNSKMIFINISPTTPILPDHRVVVPATAIATTVDARQETMLKFKFEDNIVLLKGTVVNN